MNPQPVEAHGQIHLPRRPPVSVVDRRAENLQACVEQSGVDLISVRPLRRRASPDPTQSLALAPPESLHPTEARPELNTGPAKRFVVRLDRNLAWAALPQGRKGLGRKNRP